MRSGGLVVTTALSSLPYPALGAEIQHWQLVNVNTPTLKLASTRVAGKNSLLRGVYRGSQVLP